MKPWHFGGAVLTGVALLVAGASIQPPARAQQTVNWQSDFEAARAVARRTGKPLFVAFRCER